MTTPATTSRAGGSRLRLSRERVLQAAVALADEHGLDAMSMRRLAQELGVEAMSLYHYFANKGELLGGMLDAVSAEMELPSPEGEWRSALRSAAISAHETLLRHPWACSLLMTPTGPSPARLRWMDSILGRLRGAGFSPEMTHHGYHALDSHIVGFTLWLLPYMALSQAQPDFAERFVAATPLEELPHLAEHIDVHLSERAGDTNEFEFGLDLILDGLARSLPSG
ncbi:MAG TPA: TetR/AcrR family transcriptional regulator C-terminal domain-containing protein [Candidatus Limnocylindria bacterium]